MNKCRFVAHIYANLLHILTIAGVVMLVLQLLLTSCDFRAILTSVIRSQKLAGPVIGGIPAGVPLLL